MWKQAFDEAAWKQGGFAVLSQLRGALERVHPATLARRGRLPGLSLEEGWENTPPERPLVIAVHGFYSNRDRAEALLRSPRTNGFPVGRFEYASDRPIEESARLLSASLVEIAAKHPARKVVLLTHSLGGVVARTVVEDPELDPGNVARLIMIAPPNHGSGLANLGLAVKPSLGGEEELEGRVALGFGHAAVLWAVGPVARQLQIDSPFLRELNARPRNPRIHYTIFLGTKAPLPAGGAHVLDALAAESDRRWHWTQWVGEGVQRRLAELPEIRSGEGDGVVSIASGRLEGVDDVVLLPFNHIEPLWDPDEPAVQQLACEVLHRLTVE